VSVGASLSAEKHAFRPLEKGIIGILWNVEEIGKFNTLLVGNIDITSML
jgi:hypothetical protein